MPRKNSLKDYIEDSYYHIYSRGINRASIFHSSHDYVVFMSLLKRYLSVHPTQNNNGIAYPHLYNDIELLAFCFMPNHIHLLIYQHDKTAIKELMQAVMTSYSMYFNKRYERTGPLFEGCYRAVLISSDSYLMHISRYIHLNPKKWQQYRYSSLAYYKREMTAEWIRPERILELFDSKEKYLDFVVDYEDYKQHMDLIKGSLANH